MCLLYVLLSYFRLKFFCAIRKKNTQTHTHTQTTTIYARYEKWNNAIEISVLHPIHTGRGHHLNYFNGDHIKIHVHSSDSRTYFFILSSFRTKRNQNSHMNKKNGNVYKLLSIQRNCDYFFLGYWFWQRKSKINH